MSFTVLYCVLTGYCKLKRNLSSRRHGILASVSPVMSSPSLPYKPKLTSLSLSLSLCPSASWGSLCLI